MSKGSELARLFHDTYERLAPDYGYETRKETRDFDPASKNGRLMIATCDAIIAAIDGDGHSCEDCGYSATNEMFDGGSNCAVCSRNYGDNWIPREAAHLTDKQLIASRAARWHGRF